MLVSFLPPSRHELSDALTLVPPRIRNSLPRRESYVSNRRTGVKLYAPWSDGEYANWCWYINSLDPENENLAYCYVEGYFNESGTVLLSNLASLRGPKGQRIVRDLSFGASKEEKKDIDRLLRQAANHSTDPDEVETLCEAGANVHSVDENYRTVLHEAVHNSNPVIIRTLAKFGADLNFGDYEGRTPLHEAAQFAKNTGIIACLVVAGADVNARTDQQAHSTCTCALGDTPLHLAVMCNDSPEIVKVLIGLGAEAGAANRYRTTPLHNVCYREDGIEEITKLLVDAGADINAKDENGWHPLMGAAMKGNEKACDALIKAGAGSVYDRLKVFIARILDRSRYL